MLTSLKRRFKCSVLRGFTLIELLVVISIIGILCAMVIPLLSPMKERARNAKCKTNLRNLYAAALSQALENNTFGRMPYARTTGYRYSASGSSDTVWGVHRGWVDWASPWRYDHPEFAQVDNDYWWPHRDRACYGHPAPWWGSEGVSVADGVSGTAGDARQTITNGSLWSYTGKSMRIYLCPTFATKYKDYTDQGDAVRSYVMNGAASHRRLVSSDMPASRMLLFTEMVIDKAFTGSTKHFVDNVADYDAEDTDWYVSDLLWRAEPDTNNVGHMRWLEDRACAYDSELVGIQNPADSDKPWECIGTFHEGTCNAVFMDGHIEELPKDGYTIENDTIRACAGDW
jgi:prepilin-type N-terminal cleavage/methylation domain-containing protein/prepilin-type processing-associated H-X9-DG protein